MNARAWAKAIAIVGVILVSAYLLGSGSPGGSAPRDEPEPEDSGLYMGLYPVIGNAPLEKADKVVIAEFLSFYCGNCYRFNEYKHRLEQKYGDRLRFRYIPIVWGEQSIKTVEAYILAERQGKGDEFADALFRAKFEEGRNISDVAVIIQVGEQVGLGEEWRQGLIAGEAAADARENLNLAAKWRVEETPTLIVNGRIVVSPHPTGDDVDKMAQNLDRIIQSLLS